MRHTPVRIVSIVSLLAAVAATIAAAPTGASSQRNESALDTCTPTDPLFIVVDMQPKLVSNTANQTIVITGSGFHDGAVVVVDRIGGLDTTVVSGTVLSAIVPKDSPANEDDVRVINGDGNNCPVDNTSTGYPFTLTIQGPPTTSKPEASSTFTASPQPTGTPLPTAYVRPAVNVASYGASSAIITPGTNFDFQMTVVNKGQIAANNITLQFVAGDISPRDTGGVQTYPALGPGESWTLSQPMRASDTLWSATTDTSNVTINVTYYDVNAEKYTDTFTLTFSVYLLGSSATPTATPTASATPIINPRLVIEGYDTGANPVAPGDQFDLTLKVHNVGNSLAKGVTMIFSGGQTSTGNNATASANGDFSNFAPQDGSNVRYVGDVDTGQIMNVQQTLVVNGSALSGAYPVAFSFVYVDDYGQNHTDQQVITVLVVSVPKLQISFYEEPQPFVVGESNLLPLQIVNQGLNTVTLGGMKVEGGNAKYSNNIILVGALDPGSYFTLDAIVVPADLGPLDFNVSVDYTDAFNRSQTITQTMTINVTGSLTPTPAAGAAQETASQGGFLQTLWRAILGFFGIGG